jgi:hypothetical protein
VVDSLSASPPVVAPGEVSTITVEAHDPDCPDACTSGCGLYVRADLTAWSATGGTVVAEDNGTSGSPYTASADWQAPAEEATYTVTVTLADSGTFICGGRKTTTAAIDILVTTNPNLPPVVESLTATPSLLLPGETSQLLCVATDPDDDPVTYSWVTDLGTVVPGAAGAAVYTAPTEVVGFDTVTCTASDDIASGSDTVQIAIIGAEAEKELLDELAAPQRLGADSEGNLYVADRRAGGITVINLFTEELVYRIPYPDVTSVAVDWKDDLLIGSGRGANVHDRDGEVVLPLDPGGRPGDVSDVAVDLVNRRYGVLYRGSGRLVVYDEAGVPVFSVGSLAAAPGGDWLVADSGHGQVKRFDAAGTLTAVFGTQGGDVGEFVQLDDVLADANGIIYASDTFQSWVQVFDPDGTLRESLGGYGDELGQLKTPTGMVEVAGVSGLGDFNRLVVASANTSSLQVFRRDRDPLVGPPPSADAAVTPLAIDFPNTAVGQISPGASASLSNVGTALLGVQGVTTSGPFAASHSCVVLERGESCSIGLSFAPHVPGPQAGELSIDTASGLLTVPLTGEAFLPADVEMKPARITFADQEISTVSEPEAVTLTNIGSAALEIATISASADYLVSHDCPAMLPGSAGCTLEVRFAPESIDDELLGTVTVLSSAVGSPHVVELLGPGVPTMPRFRVRSLDPDGIEEGNGAPVEARFEITLEPTSAHPASVHYEVVTGSADAGDDFQPAAGQLEFAPGQSSQIISVPIVGDEILEPDAETFSLELWGSLGVTLIEDGSAETVVLDDEVCLGPVLLANAGAEVLNGATPIPGWTESPTASWAIRSQSPEPHEGIGYFAAPPTELAELAQEIDLSGFADAIDAGRQLVEFSARVRTAADDDDTARVLIEYRNWDKTVVLDRFDSGDISSPGAWQEVTDLRAVPPDTRWVRVRLLGLRLTGPENDVFFDALSLRTIRAATVDVADFSAYEGSDGFASSVLSVRLACPYYQPVFVDLATSDDTALAGQDYLAAATTVMLPAGETEERVAIDLVGDLHDEGHEAFFVDVANVDPVDAVPLTEQAVGVILDDDSCPLSSSAWAANADLLPLRLALGGVVYEHPELVAFLVVDSGRDVTLDVARELVATRLNLRMGTHPSILPIADMADTFLATHPPGSTPGGEDLQLGKELSDELKRYNKRRACKLGPAVPAPTGAAGPGE